MQTPAFLNLDLDLRSHIELAPLADHFREAASLLHYGSRDGEYRLTAETATGGLPGDTPERCSQEMLATIEDLPPQLMHLFEQCHQRTFDYGFDGGSEAPALSTHIPTDQVARIAALGLSIRVTVHPVTAHPL